MENITSEILKQKWFEFYLSKGYKRIASASVIPENDATVLFTTAGMHPLVPYLLGEKHPSGDKLCDVQKCIRTNDIESVGDSSHCTFFEMLGNWTLGECDKAAMIKNSYEFLTSEKFLSISPSKLYVTVFEGDESAPKDEVAHDAWRAVGLSEDHIFYLPKEDNWWALGGGTGPCGPDTEMFFDTGLEKCGNDCKPGCHCGKYIEIWNDVFMQYNVKEAGGKAERLAKPNIDTGMGVERTVCVLNGVKSVYDVGAFKDAIELIEDGSSERYESVTKPFRVIADHMRAATFILGDDQKVVPAPVGQGYVLRRLIRRSVNCARNIGFDCGKFGGIIDIFVDYFKGEYPELERNRQHIQEEIKKEVAKFEGTIVAGQKEFEKVAQYCKDGVLSGKTAFRLYDTFGFPLELTIELAEEHGLKVDTDGYKAAFEKHQELSRAGAEQLFKGGLADTSEQTARLHTATHLLLAGLNKVLGGGIFQKGSNITPERLRLDFNFDRKVLPEELERVEKFVNDAIIRNIEVVCEQMSSKHAHETGAIGIFDSKYGDMVKVYTIGDLDRQICGGPHAKNTGELKHFKIIKEESSSSGIRRIKAIID